MDDIEHLIPSAAARAIKGLSQMRTVRRGSRQSVLSGRRHQRRAFSSSVIQ